MIQEKEISYSVILMWHKILFKNSKPDIAGRIRTHQVAISGSSFLPPSPVEVYPELMDFFKWYKKNKENTHPVEIKTMISVGVSLDKRKHFLYSNAPRSPILHRWPVKPRIFQGKKSIRWSIRCADNQGAFPAILPKLGRSVDIRRCS